MLGSSRVASQTPLIAQGNSSQPSEKPPLHKRFSNLKDSITKKLHGSVDSHFETHFGNPNTDYIGKVLDIIQCEQCLKDKKFAAIDAYLTCVFKQQKKPSDSKVFTVFAVQKIKELYDMLPEGKKPIASEYLHKKEYEKTKLYKDLKNKEDGYRRKFIIVYNHLNKNK